MRRRSSCGSYLLVQSFVRVTAHRRMVGTKSIDAVQQLQFRTHLLEALHGLPLLCSSCRRSGYGSIGLRLCGWTRHDVSRAGCGSRGGLLVRGAVVSVLAVVAVVSAVWVNLAATLVVVVVPVVVVRVILHIAWNVTFHGH
jgi:hypothetical protein